MLKIGDFARFTKISIHMLRHYDEIGLLTPASIDEASSYRYYLENQIPYANKIQLLKAMGFSLSSIKQILQNNNDENNFKKYLELQLSNKEDEIKKLENQTNLLKEALIDLKAQKDPLKYSPIVKEIPKRYVVSYRGLIPYFNHEGILWNALREATSTMKLKYTTPEIDIAIIHSCDSFGMVDVEVQRAVDKKYESSIENVVFKEIPAGLAATVAYQGGYEQLEHINVEKMATWILKNGYELDGEIMNIYYISPKTTHNSNEFITEVCFPIKIKKT